MAAVKTPPTIVDRLKAYESELSTILGFLVVVAIGIALLFFLRRSSLNSTPKISDAGEQTQTENLMKKEDKKHIVVAGEGLWQIAEKEYGDGYKWSEIAKANNLKSPYVVSAGQELVIPTLAQASAAPVAPTAPAAPSAPVAAKPTVTPAPVKATPAPVATGTGTYTVVKGDSLWKIAVKEYQDGYKWVEIYRANKAMIGANPGIIQPGQQLTIPSLK